MANPASQNCVKVGGTLDIRTRSDGSQYGVCLFEDNRQCEEWALLRGDCPEGGLKITGYVTPAAQFCAITGGQYAVTGNSNTDQEQGTCTFKDGQTCDVWEYYAGTCVPSAATPEATYDDPFAYCAAVGTIDAPDASYAGPAMPDSVVQGLVKLGVVAADAPPDFQNNAVWRCMDGQVWACHFGANLPCQERADASQTPTAEMQQYCTENPTSDAIPAAVTGRATVYDWNCADGEPVASEQLFHADAQGYLAEFWYQLAP
jgi:putative hemolysin